LEYGLRRSLQWVIGLVISALALWWAFRNVPLPELAAALQTARYGYVLPALVCILLGQLTRTNIWRTLLGRDLSFLQVFSALNAGYLLNNLLPFRLGEVGRAYLISRSGKLGVPQALSAVLIERVLDLCMIVAFLLAFLPLAVGLMGTRWAVGAAILIPVSALGALVVIARRPAWLLRLVSGAVGLTARLWGGATRLESLFHAFVDGLAALQDSGRLIRATIWSGLTWVFAGLSASLIVAAFVPDRGWPETLTIGYFVLVVVGLGIALPSAPASVGVWQAATVAALSVFGIVGGPALSFALVNHLVNFSLMSLLGVWSLLRERESLGHLAQAASALLRENAAK
jgi:hypothetical protein